MPKALGKRHVEGIGEGSLSGTLARLLQLTGDAVVAFDGAGVIGALEDTNDIGFQAVEIVDGFGVETEKVNAALEEFVKAKIKKFLPPINAALDDLEAKGTVNAASALAALRSVFKEMGGTISASTPPFSTTTSTLKRVYCLLSPAKISSLLNTATLQAAETLTAGRFRGEPEFCQQLLTKTKR